MSYPDEPGAVRSVFRPDGDVPGLAIGGTMARFVATGAVTAWTDAGPGDFLHVPVGGVHAFANDSGSSASMLILFCPGMPRESYFEELAERIASGRDLGPDERAAFLARHDQYMV